MKPELTGFGYGFGFSPISKDGVGAGNGDIDTHPVPVPEPAPLILKLDFTSFKLEILKQSLKLHSYVYFFIFNLSIKQTIFSISFLYLKKYR